MRRSHIRRSNLTNALGVVLGLVMGVTALTACGTNGDTSDKASDTASRVQDGASKATDIIGGLPTSASDVRDQLTGKLQKVSITLDSETCSQTNGVELHVKSLGSEWKHGPYVTFAEHSATKDGDYQPVDPSTYGSVKPDINAFPPNTWHWNCGIPKDHLGYLRFSIAKPNSQGKLDMATKWVYVRVVA